MQNAFLVLYEVVGFRMHQEGVFSTCTFPPCYEEDLGSFQKPGKKVHSFSSA
jgi:hypothetical protein